MPHEPIRAAIERHLLGELSDPAVATPMATLVCDLVLDWRASTMPPDQVRTIFAFTFGNRMLPNGNRLPGPVNTRLADLAVSLHGATGAKIFAQWEIAEAVGTRVATDKLVAINPGRDDRGEPVYLSTAGVLEAIAAQASPATLGPVGVIAFADHLFRCVGTARRFGFEAAAPDGMTMPREYDPQSGQAWCRSRLAYLLHDVMIRVAERRAAELVSPSAPAA